MKREYHSYSEVKLGGWYFKASDMDGIYLVVAFHPLLHNSLSRFFQSKTSAYNWIDYIVFTSNGLQKILTEKD